MSKKEAVKAEVECSGCKKTDNVFSLGATPVCNGKFYRTRYRCISGCWKKFSGNLYETEKEALEAVDSGEDKAISGSFAYNKVREPHLYKKKKRIHKCCPYCGSFRSRGRGFSSGKKRYSCGTCSKNWYTPISEMNRDEVLLKPWINPHVTKMLRRDDYGVV